MADNIEIKVEQLTSAIRGLYDKPCATVGDLNSAVSDLSKKFEGINDAAKDKLGQVLISDIRRILEEKQNHLEGQLIGFESALKQISENLPDDKLSSEMKRILSETSTVYGKISNQEALLNNITRVLDGSGTREELEKLKNEIAVFSRGFESITQSLNKNFNDFLLQIKSYSHREEFKKVFQDIDNVANNTNAIISALAIIDHKYKDLTGLIDVFSKKENAFSRGLEDLSRDMRVIETFSNSIKNVSSKEDFRNLNENFNERTVALEALLNDLRAFSEASDSSNKQKFDGLIFSIENKLNSLKSLVDLESLREDVRKTGVEIKESSYNNKSEILSNIDRAFSELASFNATLKNDFAIQGAALSENLETHKKEVTANVNDALSGLASLNLLKDNFAAQGSTLSENLRTLNEEILKLHGYITQNIEYKTNEIRFDIKGMLEDVTKMREKIDSQAGTKELGESMARLSDESFVKMYDIIREQLITLDGSIENRVAQNQTELKGEVSSLKDEIRNISNSLSGFKSDFAEHNKKNTELVKEPLERALKNLENLTVTNELKQLSAAVDYIILDIKRSFDTMKDDFKESSANSNIEVLKQLNQAIPAITDRLEAFRENVKNENSSHLEELKKYFSTIPEIVKKNFENFDKDFGEQISQSIKFDMQKLSDHLTESVEGVSSHISREFSEHKTNIDELLVRVNDWESKFKEKIEYFENKVETITQDTCERISKTLSGANPTNASSNSDVQYENIIKTAQEEIVKYIENSQEHAGAEFSELNAKMEKLELSLASLGERSAQSDHRVDGGALSDIENKLERANL
ncbi:hypothetical protein tpqmel_0803, partial [Candidatus Gastranaerophilus sp. (ex Termes propinquus)]